VPDINGFIPQDLKMKSLCSATNTALVEVEQVPLFEGDCRRNELKFESFLKYPMLLKHDLEGRVYWRLERSFEVPAVFVGIRFQTPYLAQDGRKAVMLNLFNGYMEQCLG
jgi:secreted Zn-dependent insulinase-like peptidase